jgi:hypothetical protein
MKTKKVGVNLVKLMVLASRGMARLSKRLKEARRGLLGVPALPPSAKKEREPGASMGEAEVCKLNPTPAGVCISP